MQVKDVLLTRRGVVFAATSPNKPLHDYTRAVAIELADLGYVMSERLRARLACMPVAELMTLLRHRAYWVWAGEFMHPHEHAKKCPGVARAFQLVRRHDEKRIAAPRFTGFQSIVEAALKGGQDVTPLLSQRPGDFLRRFDHVLRTAKDPQTVARICPELIDYLQRLRKREGDQPGAVTGDPLFAALYRGTPLPDDSEVYALFREQLTRTVAASELLS